MAEAAETKKRAGWPAERKSHEGLLAAGYRLYVAHPGIRPEDEPYPPKCRFCPTEIVWYVTPNGKMQPFNASTFEPHHGECAEFAEFRKKQREAAKQVDK